MNKIKAERTCVNCRKKAEKEQLFRILRMPTGEVVFDKTGKANGRGAYVCSPDCFASALDNGKLSRALRVKLTDEIYRIEDEILRFDSVGVV